MKRDEAAGPAAGPSYWHPDESDVKQLVLVEAVEGEELAVALMAATGTIPGDQTWASRRTYVPMVSRVVMTMVIDGLVEVRDVYSATPLGLQEALQVMRQQDNWWRPLSPADTDSWTTVDEARAAEWFDAGGYGRYWLDITAAGLAAMRPIPIGPDGGYLPPWLRPKS